MTIQRKIIKVSTIIGGIAGILFSFMEEFGDYVDVNSFNEGRIGFKIYRFLIYECIACVLGLISGLIIVVIYNFAKNAR